MEVTLNQLEQVFSNLETAATAANITVICDVTVSQPWDFSMRARIDFTYNGQRLFTDTGEFFNQKKIIPVAEGSTDIALTIDSYLTLKPFGAKIEKNLLKINFNKPCEEGYKVSGNAFFLECEQLPH